MRLNATVTKEQFNECTFSGLFSKAQTFLAIVHAKNILIEYDN